MLNTLQGWQQGSLRRSDLWIDWIRYEAPALPGSQVEDQFAVLFTDPLADFAVVSHLHRR